MWFKSYLQNRQQRVVINNLQSEWASIKAGVPQGSILGPLLFLVYVDDIVKDIESDIFLFADDTSLIEYITNPVISFDKINRDLQRLYLWSSQWLVSFNPSKTEYIVFSKRLNKVAYGDLKLGDVTLEKVEQHKQLGIILNDRMTFDDHANYCAKNAMKRISALKRVNHRFPRRSRLQIYLSFIRPVLEFGWQFYDNTSKDISDKLERVQREALLTVTGAYKKTKHSSLLKEVGVPTLKNRREMFKCNFIFKHLNNLLPGYFEKIMPPQTSERTQYNLRNAHDLTTPQTTKNYFLKSFIPSSITTWNRLDNSIKCISNIEDFKIELKKDV